MLTEEEKMDYAGLAYLRSGVKEPETVYELYINDFPFVYLPENLRAAKQLRSLTIIDSHNLDWQHAASLVQQFQKLKYLALVSNTFDYFPIDTDSLQSLEELHLEDLQNIDFGRTMTEVARFKNLKKLFLYKLPYERLPEQILELPKLADVFIGANSDLDYEQHFDLLSKVKSLKSLLILESDLKRLPNNFRHLDLQKLRFYECKELDYEHALAEAQHFKKLQSLEISVTDMAELPKNIRQLGNLKKLVLYRHYNLDFEKLDSALSHLTNLEELELISCGPNPNDVPEKPKRLPESIRKMKNLRVLKIDNLRQLDLEHTIDILTDLPALEEFSMEYISVYDWKPMILPPSFEELTSLKKLNVSISSQNIFDSLDHLPPNITHLSKAGRPGETFPYIILELKNLKSLDLRHNQLTTIPIELTQLQHLEHLDLSENQLEDLPDEIAELKNLKFLHLVENPLSEDEEKQKRIKALLPNTIISFYE